MTDEDPRIVNARKDGIVQQTDQDASISRMSAVDVGYLDDQFAKFFAVPGQLRRFPIINRGMAGVNPIKRMALTIFRHLSSNNSNRRLGQRLSFCHPSIS